jgi:hypothetical protein
MAALRGWRTCYLLFLFYFNYFHNTHQVLVWLPQGVGGFVFLVYFSSFV